MNSELLVAGMHGAAEASGAVSAETWLKCKNIEIRHRTLSESWVSIEVSGKVRVRESFVESSL